jgi:3-hydroxy-D-aspartate aldolase
MVPHFLPPQTPALVIDRQALTHNLAVMQAACDAAGVRLRAHGKMHKCSTLGLLQIAGGAVGLCCQTVGEAEAFARGGIGDVLITSPLPGWGAARLAALAVETGATIAAVADSAAQIDRLGAAAREAGTILGCLVDVDLGMNRVGCTPDTALELAMRVCQTPGLRYAGIQSYFGHLQHAPDRAPANAESAERLRALVEALNVAGLAPPEVTGGGTGTYALDLANGVFTELQCGSYAVMDVDYDKCGGPEGDWPFRPAMFVVATVVSAQHKARVAVDAGLKALAVDGPMPRVVAGAAPGSKWRSMGDEHGAIIHPGVPAGEIDAIDVDPAIPWPHDAPREGDLVWLQPGHCDPTINLYDGVWVVGADGPAEFWPIDARRMSV